MRTHLHMKVVACVPIESDVSPQSVEDVLQLPSQHNNTGSSSHVLLELLQARDPLAALAIASKAAVLCSNAALEVSPMATECMEHTTVVLGKLSPRYLLLPTVPSRSLVESALYRSARSSTPTENALLMAIFAYPGERLQNPLSLAVQLSTSIGLIETSFRDRSGRDQYTPNNASPSSTRSATLASYLPPGTLKIGRERVVEDPFVEVRSLVEYDAIVDALFDSPSFQRVLALCSVQVVLKTMPLGGARRGGAGVDGQEEGIALHSTWLMAPKHAAEFASTRTTHQSSIVRMCTEPYRLSQDVRCRAPRIVAVVLAAFHLKELLNMSSFVHTLSLGNSSTADRYFPPSAQSVLDENARHARPIVPKEHRLPPPPMGLVGQHPSGESSHATTIAVLQGEVQRLGTQFDATERLFQQSVARHSEELARLKESKETLARLEATLASKAEPRRTQDELRKTLVLELAEVKEDCARLQTIVDGHATATDRRDAERSAAANALEAKRTELLEAQKAELDAMMNELRNEEDRLNQRLSSSSHDWSDEYRRSIERLTAELRSKESEWKRREDDLTKNMATAAALQAAAEDQQQMVRERERTREALTQELHVVDSSLMMEGGGASLRGGVDPSKASVVAVVQAAQQEAERQQAAVDAATETYATDQSRYASDTALLRQEEAHVQALQEEMRSFALATQRTMDKYHASAMECWQRMFVSFAALEENHRWTLRSMEECARCDFSTEEAASWVRALHDAEHRFSDEARWRCREEIFGIETRMRQLHQARDAAKAKRQEAERQLASTQQRHNELRRDSAAHLDGIRSEEHNLLMFVQGHPMPETGAAFPTLEEDTRHVRQSIERLRATLATGVVVRRAGAGGVDRKKRHGAFAAQLNKAMHITVDDMVQRLEILVRDAQREQASKRASMEGATRRLALVESDLEGRKDVLSRAVQHTTTIEKQLNHVHATAAATSEEILVRKSKHEQLRQQLQEEFITAKETSARHRKDGNAHLRSIEGEEERLTLQLLSTNKGLHRLEEARDALLLKNPASSVSSLQLRIQREVQRQEEMQQLIDTEEALLSRARQSAHEQASSAPHSSYMHASVSASAADALCPTPSAVSRLVLDQSTSKLIMSPTPD